MAAAYRLQGMPSDDPETRLFRREYHAYGALVGLMNDLAATPDCSAEIDLRRRRVERAKAAWWQAYCEKYPIN